MEEGARRRREAQLHLRAQALEASVNGIAISDLGARLTYVNPSFLRLWGYDDPGEVLGRQASSFWQSGERADEIVRELHRSGGWTGELPALRKGGGEFLVHISASLLRDEAGAPAGMLGSFIDVTERRRSENRVRHLTRLYALLSQVNQAVVRARERGEFFRALCRVAVEHGQFRMAWVGLLGGDGTVRPEAADGAVEGYLEAMAAISSRQAPSGRGPTGTALREGAVVVCDDIASDARMAPWREEALRRGYRSSAAVPFRERGRIAGALSLYAAEPGFFAEEDRRLLEEIGTDITFALDALAVEGERRAAVEALHQSEERLRFLSENLAEGMVYQIDTGTDGRRRSFTYLSPAVARLHGLPLEEALRDPSAIYGQVVGEHRALLAAREQEAFAARTTLDAEVLVRLPNGELRWRRFISAPREMADGRVLWSGIELDVTREREMEEAVRQRERDLLEVQRLSRIASFRWDRATDAVEWSPEFYRIVERPAGSFPQSGAGFLALLHPRDRARIRRAVDDAVAGAAPLQVEARLPLEGGREKHLSFTAVAKRGDDDARALVGFLQDVSERRQAERLRAQFEEAQKMESVGRLAGGVAHDFNNMLGVILAHAELALLKSPPGPVRADLEEIRGAAHRSAELTRQLLAFARRQPVAPRALDLNEVVGGMLKLLRRLIGEGIDLDWLPGAALWPVRMDPSQVDQVLANLCVNARDAIAGVGRIAIRTGNATLGEDFCRAHPDCAPGEYVRLTVSDDGQGMDDEVLGHAFEPFFTTKEVGRGTGLGLATVYGIVRQNGGVISVESAPGAGTTFTIHLPRCAGAAETGVHPVPEAPRGTGETVLLVEDEPSILRVGTTLLEGLGYRVLAAAAPDEALDIARGHAGGIDLLLTDVVMPGMNGRDLAARVAALRPGIACVFMSGYAADAVGGAPDGRLRFVQKPFSLTTLASAVRVALDGRGEGAGGW